MMSLEQQIIANGLPVESLMEKVGGAMANWLLKRDELLQKGVIVLIGPGHNGGDGLVVARELHLAGVNVQVWCPLKICKPLTSAHWSYINWLGVKEISGSPDPKASSLWIEALFGLGQTRALPEPIGELLKERQKHQPDRLISLDVPAGICSDTGRELPGGAAFAESTLTAGLIKQGLVQDQAIKHVGNLIRIEIGLPKIVLKALAKEQPKIIYPEDLSSIPWPQIPTSSTKYQRGKVLVIAGSRQYRGAAYLAIQGVLSSGAGNIQAAIPEIICNPLCQKAPEVVIAAELESSSSGGLLINNWLANFDLNKFDAILIGPGLGKSNEPWSEGTKPLQSFSGLLVIDADGLNRMATTTEKWNWLKNRTGPTWITPHRKEFDRLFPNLQGLPAPEAAIQASRISGAEVLLKGAHSVVSDPSGATWQVIKTAPWSARSGLGDVLAGYATGLGAIGKASSNNSEKGILPISMFLHAQAARNSKTGSKASSIASVLGEITIALQSRHVFIGT